LRETVDGLNAARFPITDAGIVDHRVKPAQRVDLLRSPSRLGDTRQVADNDGLGLRKQATRVSGAPVIPRVQRHLMIVSDEQARGH